MEKYAYVRVSSKEQNLDRQLLALKPYDIPDKNIFCDYQSGKNFERPGYKKLMKKIKRGDVIFIKSIDRLGRNYNDILTEWKCITKEKHVDIVVLDMEILDTRNRDNNLTGTLISDLVLQILAYVSQKEREYIHARQAEGIVAAKAKGVKFGCPRHPLPEGFQEYCDAWMKGEITLKEGADKLGMSVSTFFRRCNELLKDNS